ncbi:rab effector Noc2-like [Daphnia carinata]|uniref:rab effector Noc2-like n=1 Tax=Daphnia carinata TaxID=120202 RepID=UPI00257B0D1E|nr:rab effector Noc2-like [Daphnia carinata]
MEDDGNAGDAWVPPNDRQLALRAKLHYGWSSSAKSKRIDTNASKWSQPTGASEPLTREEQEKVVQVIRRAEEVSGNEQLRVSKLVDRVRNIQKNAVGSDGTNQCVLCGDYASVFLSWSLTSARHVTCKDCLKSVCQKCSVDTSVHPREPTYLCKLCSERRETWKKSGAWFYKIT